MTTTAAITDSSLLARTARGAGWMPCAALRHLGIPAGAILAAEAEILGVLRRAARRR